MAPTVAPFADLLRSAVNEPGIISAAYRQFHNYSIGNQLLAWAQCIERGLQPGPISTFMAWREKGRHVKKGQKAITLCSCIGLTGSFWRRRRAKSSRRCRFRRGIARGRSQP